MRRIDVLLRLIDANGYSFNNFIMLEKIHLFHTKQ